jgi:DNA repair protein RadA/Sms
MAKIKSQYGCQACGYTTSKWLGRCPACEQWNSFVEERKGPEHQSTRDSVMEMAGVHGALRAGGIGGRDYVPLDPETDDEKAEARARSAGEQKRLHTGMAELDRVLGGGLVPDSFVLLGGDPGIGKSTLLLQMARGLQSANPGLKILYVSGEESIDQIRGRAHRLGVQGKGRIFLATETQLEQVFASVKELKPDVVVMDSLQTFSSGELESAPGSVSQVREVAVRLMALAKSAGIAVWLVGHVTKEGSIAGPKAVEHMVDTVLYFEAEAGATYRLLRTVKNRFGSTRELGVFEMEGEGLKEVSNPSSLFLSERKEPVAGTAVGVSLEGSRPILIELQALVAPTVLAVPRRTSVGIDGNRISLLAAILEKHMRLTLGEQDLFFNVAGGLRIDEPACDLAAAAAIWSSFEEKPLPPDWAFIGELGLTGEVRRVAQLETRLEESKKLGFKNLVVPRSSLERIGSKFQGLKLHSLSRIDELPSIFRS